MTDAKEVVAETNGEENNKKEESVQEEPSEFERDIISQVEYYFGDLNILRDQFLLNQMKLDDGWVTLNILTRFNRLAKMTRNTEIIAKALNKATNGLLEMSKDNKKVRRNPEVPIPGMNYERKKELSKRTIYAKGFPKDATLDDLLRHFNQNDEVEKLVMRNYRDRSSYKLMFKGSVYIIFKTKEQAEKFMEEKPHWYLGKELLVLWQSQKPSPIWFLL